MWKTKTFINGKRLKSDEKKIIILRSVFQT